jgi:hypothetical protein
MYQKVSIFLVKPHRNPAHAVGVSPEPFQLLLHKHNITTPPNRHLMSLAASREITEPESLFYCLTSSCVQRESANCLACGPIPPHAAQGPRPLAPAHAQSRSSRVWPPARQGAGGPAVSRLLREAAAPPLPYLSPTALHALSCPGLADVLQRDCP